MTDDFRLLVTGTRSLSAAGRVLLRDRMDMYLNHAKSLQKRLVVVQGDCPSGADRDARAWAWEQQIEGGPVVSEGHPAKGHPTQNFGDWPEAGPRRNRYMVGLGADQCEAFIDACVSTWCRRPGVHPSHGASGCADLAEAAKIPTIRWELWKI